VAQKMVVVLKTERMVVMPWLRDMVHLLWLVKEMPEREEDIGLLIGAYSSNEEARAASCHASFPTCTRLEFAHGKRPRSLRASIPARKHELRRVVSSGLGPLATEGAREIARYGFEILGVPELVSFTVPVNTRSIRVMKKLGMSNNPRDDFDHPRLPVGHPLRRHVLYRLELLKGGEAMPGWMPLFTLRW